MTLKMNGRLRDGLYGWVDLGKVPFEIQLNGRVLTQRKAVSLIHEMMHVWTRMYKIPLSHDNLHRISVGIMTDLLPVLDDLRKKGIIKA